MTADEARAGAVEQHLLEVDGVQRMVTTPQQSMADTFVITADVEPSSADSIVDVLAGLEVAAEDYVLTRMDVVAPVRSDQRSLSRASSIAWVEVIGEARANSRPLGRYLVLMAVAGVIAGIGVTEANAILIVGAMAVSPDLLPICATCVGLANGRLGLARRSAGTLMAGLGLSMAFALAVTLLLRAVDIIPDAFVPAQTGVVESLTNVDHGTLIVAFAAGIAGILSFETRTGSAVGVAISVTTIPAAAYFGVAIAIGDTADALGALLVLVTNVIMMVLAGCITLWVQRRES